MSMSATPIPGSEWNTLTCTPPRRDSTSTSSCHSRSQRCAVWNGFPIGRPFPLSLALSHAEVGLPDRCRTGELAGRALPDHLALGQDVDDVGGAQGQAVVLLDQKDPQPAPAQVHQHLADPLDDHRREDRKSTRLNYSHRTT